MEHKRYRQPARGLLPTILHSGKIGGMQTFIENVERHRKARGIPKATLAVQAGLDRSFLSRLLSGKHPTIGIDTAEAIATAIGVPLWRLLRPTAEERRKIA